MTTETSLIAVLDRHPTLAIAVSGGVDSMMLAYLAHKASQASVSVVHARSPAVPNAATRRVEDYARRYGWDLRVVDAAELSNPNYQANPVNRCYYCKSNLYASIRAVTSAPIASGTNTDDLNDYRPGLIAAQECGVIHPYVAAGIDKAGIYSLARAHGLTDLSVLPAQPCLASRIETGIPISADDLSFVERIEAIVSDLSPGTVVRCRMTAKGVCLEFEPLPDEAIIALVADHCRQTGRPFAGSRPYRRGAAFLR